MNQDLPRLVYRFENFKNAFARLSEGVKLSEEKELSDLEKEGIIQRFEFTFELSWKLLKDYLEEEGVILKKLTPRSIIREAFKAQIIEDGDLWMKMVDARNESSHLYDKEKFEKIFKEIGENFFPELEKLYNFFNQQYERWRKER